MLDQFRCTHAFLIPFTLIIQKRILTPKVAKSFCLQARESEIGKPFS